MATKPKPGEKGSNLAVIKRKDGSTQVVNKHSGKIVSETNKKGVKVVRTAVDTRKGRTTTRSRPVTSQKEAFLQDRSISQQKKVRELEAQQRFLEKARAAIQKENARARGEIQRQQNIARGVQTTRSQREATRKRNLQIISNKLSLTRGGREVAKIMNLEAQRNIRTVPPSQKEIYLKNLKLVVQPRTKSEERFFKGIDRQTGREKRTKEEISLALSAAGLNIKETDKWYQKALKGLGTLGVTTLYSGQFIAGVFDKAQLQVRSLGQKKDVRKAGSAEAKRALKATPKTVALSLDPRKPENWASLVFLALGGKALRKVQTSAAKRSPGFVPSIKNPVALKNTLKIQLNKVKAAQTLAKKGIKARSGVAFNKRLLKKLQRLEKNIDKSITLISKLQKSKKVLQLEDFNPFVETSKLLKSVGQEKTLFHATSASPSTLFGQSRNVLKSPKQILAKASQKKAKRPVKATKKIEKEFISIIKRNRNILTGGRAQNVFVKSFFKRKSRDFDVLSRKPATDAKNTYLLLKKKFPKKKVSLESFKAKGQKFKVYRIKVNGKNFADFDPIPKGVKPVKVDGVFVADPKFLLERKLSTVTDPMKAFRQKKDLGDAKRILGFFSSKKVVKKVQDPKNYLTVTPRPAGMGASRIKFGETQMFFDFSIPTSYAYQSLARNIFPKTLLDLAKKIGVKKSFIKKLDSFKYIRANDRFTVLTTKTRISNFSPAIRAKINKAKKGQLSQSQINSLRREINSFINKNPNKALVGSRTGSQPKGEREIVLAVGSKIKRVSDNKIRQVVKPKGTKFSFDPETKVFFKLVETTVKNAKKAKKPVPKTLRKRLTNLFKRKYNSIERKYLNTDLAKVKRFKRLIKRADKLTDVGYLDFLLKFKALFGSSKAARAAARSSKRARTRVPTRRKIVVRSKKGSASRAVAVRSAPTTKKRAKNAKKSVARKKVTSTKRTKARTKPRTRSRTRRIARRPTVSSRVTSRASPRKRPRTTKRTSPRARPVARTPTRPRTPTRRIPTRTRVPPRRKPTRPRTPPRRIPPPSILRTYYKRIPLRFKKKLTTKKDKEAVIRWYKKQEVKYKPSLAAILLGVTSYKIPKRITGFEVRPIIIKKR